ncbi:hypothetical protein RHGRI_007631 [Rhododendron griersonianum]|uniref:Uncharacterized protein n=1 Tax=Rhododendron griersonianum TaxID=479676 RepID=A0AAV6KXH2_9ERIC|nr:hypothetical protein RHGRI_007631 [Rhododendron griersonianum]
MLKVTRSSNQHLALALQINPSFQLLRQFDQQIEEQINANMQKELEEFQQNVIWNEIAIDEIAIPGLWIKPTVSIIKPCVLELQSAFDNRFPMEKNSLLRNVCEALTGFVTLLCCKHVIVTDLLLFILRNFDCLQLICCFISQ